MANLLNPFVPAITGAKNFLGIGGTPETRNQTEFMTNLIGDKLNQSGSMTGGVDYTDYGSTTADHPSGDWTGGIWGPEFAYGTTLGKADYKVDPYTGKVDWTGGTDYDFPEGFLPGRTGKFISDIVNKGGISDMTGGQPQQYTPNINIPLNNPTLSNYRGNAAVANTGGGMDNFNTNATYSYGSNLNNLFNQTSNNTPVDNPYLTNNNNIFNQGTIEAEDYTTKQDRVFAEREAEQQRLAAIEQQKQEQIRQEQARQEQIRQEQIRQNQESARRMLEAQAKARAEQQRQEQARQEQIRQEQIRQNQESARKMLEKQAKAKAEKIRQEQIKQNKESARKMLEKQAKAKKAAEDKRKREAEAKKKADTYERMRKQLEVKAADEAKAKKAAEDKRKREAAAKKKRENEARVKAQAALAKKRAAEAKAKKAAEERERKRMEDQRRRQEPDPAPSPPPPRPSTTRRARGTRGRSAPVVRQPNLFSNQRIGGRYGL